ncbi:uncharacterized protein LOC126687769 [Mercurialis annua]|uniref:uncharacterized protein LOC126687769 n=1 Tax=Mercurialis annua TaxID=3986 RepID=UPI0021603AC4|nr:uncharacterized protein LOC126687769 [Mercurialis annua]
MMHLFFHCPFAETVWIGTNEGILDLIQEQDCLKGAWLALDQSQHLMQAKIELMSKVVWIMWSLWQSRNGLIFRDEFDDPSRVISAATILQTEAKRAELSLQVMNSTRSSETVITATAVWTPPPPTSFKINFDGAFKADLSIGVGACVVRDHSGKVIHTVTNRYFNVISPAMVEARAMRDAILLAKRIRLPTVIFEGDAKGILEAMSLGTKVDSSCEVILEDCRAMLANDQSYSFQFVRRACNWVANMLAKKALRDVNFGCNSLAQMVWLDVRLSESISNQ